VEGVVGNKAVRARLDRIAVGLAAHCDPPKVEQKLLHYFTEKFAGAPSLPFVAFVTDDFRYVHGFHGGRSLKQFLEDLDRVEKSPLLPASKEVEEKLAGLASKAAKAVEGGKWAQVLAAGRKGAALKGRCAPRDDLEAAVEQARDWAASRFDWVEDEAATAADTKPLRAALKDVARRFKGEAEEAQAKAGLKALDHLAKIAKLDGDKAAAARAKAATELTGTRWASLFRAPDAD
jgi:hypothetical protein